MGFLLKMFECFNILDAYVAYKNIKKQTSEVENVKPFAKQMETPTELARFDQEISDSQGTEEEKNSIDKDVPQNEPLDNQEPKLDVWDTKFNRKMVKSEGEKTEKPGSSSSHVPLFLKNLGEKMFKQSQKLGKQNMVMVSLEF